MKGLSSHVKDFNLIFKMTRLLNTHTYQSVLLIEFSGVSSYYKDVHKMRVQSVRIR